MPGASRSVAVLVPSCDSYSDLWKPCFHLFHRFWPDCPFPVYLLSNHIGCQLPGVTDILVGPDESWSDSLRKGLVRLKENYVFLLLDDLFLSGSVNTRQLVLLFDWFLRLEGNCLRMNASPLPDRPYDGRVGVVSKGAIYRASTVLSLWKKTVLQQLLAGGESAWEFEVYGSVRSDAHEGFYATWARQFPVIHTVIKGKWERRALAKVKALGVEPDLGQRRVMTRAEELVLVLKFLRTGLLSLFPTQSRRRIKHAVLGGKYHYKRAV